MARAVVSLLTAFALAGCINDSGAPQWRTYEEMHIRRHDAAIHFQMAEQTKWGELAIEDWRRTGLAWGEIALLSDMSVASRVPPDDLWESMRRHRSNFRCTIHAYGIEEDLVKRYHLEGRGLPCDDCLLAEAALELAITEANRAKPEEVQGYLQAGYMPLEICEGYRAAGRGAAADKVKDIMDRERKGEVFPAVPFERERPSEKPPEKPQTEQPPQPLPGEPGTEPPK